MNFRGNMKISIYTNQIEDQVSRLNQQGYTVKSSELIQDHRIILICEKSLNPSNYVDIEPTYISVPKKRSKLKTHFFSLLSINV